MGWLDWVTVGILGINAGAWAILAGFLLVGIFTWDSGEDTWQVSLASGLALACLAILYARAALSVAGA